MGKARDSGHEAPGKTKIMFALPTDVVADLHRLVGELKARARSEGQPMPSMSDVATAALRAELKRQKQAGT